MLVLTRKLGENIVIGDNISVKVLNIDSNKVQLGVQAPASIMIYRQELIDKVKEQNKTAVIRKRRDVLTAAEILRSIFRPNN
ncbi:MAG: carbon storage regulator CsrA [Calditrichia bacterium]